MLEVRGFGEVEVSCDGLRVFEEVGVSCDGLKWRDWKGIYMCEERERGDSFDSGMKGMFNVLGFVLCSNLYRYCGTHYIFI